MLGWDSLDGKGEKLVSYVHVDRNYENSAVEFDWKMGEEQTEVHGSSGIANNAFYLLANGGKNRTSGLEVKDGIGMEKGLKVFYRALEQERGGSEVSIHGSQAGEAEGRSLVASAPLPADTQRQPATA